MEELARDSPLIYRPYALSHESLICKYKGEKGREVTLGLFGDPAQEGYGNCISQKETRKSSYRLVPA